MAKTGLLTLVSFSEKEKDLFLEYLQNYKGTHIFDVLNNLFEEDFLMFLDVFSGAVLKIPDREEIYKITGYVRIYYYYKSHGCTEEAIENASHIFQRRKNSIRRIISKVEKMLEPKTCSNCLMYKDDECELGNSVNNQLLNKCFKSSLAEQDGGEDDGTE